MFDPQSRYAALAQATLQTVSADGTTRTITYARRRFIQPPQNITTLVEYPVAQADRLDNIAAQFVGDPTQYWRICDNNGAMRPTDLTDTVGRILEIGFSLT